MKFLVIPLIFILGLFHSCSDDSRHLFVIAEDVEGLAVDGGVSMNGLAIGKIQRMGFGESGTMVIELELKMEPSLPIDSEFSIENLDLFGTKGIRVKRGTNEKLLASGDTVIASTGNRLFKSDSLTLKMKDLFEVVSGAKQQDSILIELRRLNENLEKQKMD